MLSFRISIAHSISTNFRGTIPNVTALSVETCCRLAALSVFQKPSLGRCEYISIRQPSESTPAISVVPADDEVGGVDVTPPTLEFFARDVKRRRRHEMIKDNAMLFAPVKSSNGIQVVIVKEMASYSSATFGPVQWPIEQLRGGVHERSRKL